MVICQCWYWYKQATEAHWSVIRELRPEYGVTRWLSLRSPLLYDRYYSFVDPIGSGNRWFFQPMHLFILKCSPSGDFDTIFNLRMCQVKQFHPMSRDRIKRKLPLCDFQLPLFYFSRFSESCSYFGVLLTQPYTNRLPIASEVDPCPTGGIEWQSCYRAVWIRSD